MANNNLTPLKGVNAVSSQSASKTETFKTVVCKDTTSPNEKSNNAKHYTCVTNAYEILNTNTFKNLRKAYEKRKTEEVLKTWNSVHYDIESTVKENPSRLIQRNLGSTIICDSIKVSSPGEYGINTVTCFGASLTNGAQTQGVLDSVFDEYNRDSEYFKEINVRVFINVEPNTDEQTEMKIAHNNSTNVSDLSKFGAAGIFDDLSNSMKKAGFGELAKSETDNALDPTRVLMVTRLFITDEHREDHPELKNIVKSYRNQAIVRSDFANLWRERRDHREGKNGKKKDPSYEIDAYRFFVDFAPKAWKLYLDWQSDLDWHSFWSSSRKDAKDKSNKMGTYNEKKKIFTLAWALICPVLYGLRSGVSTGTNLSFSYPKNWDKKKYMKKAFEHFKDVSMFVPQEFGKTDGTYHFLALECMKMNMN